MAVEGDLEVRAFRKKAPLLFAIAILTIGCSTSPDPLPAAGKEASSVGSTVGSIVRLDPAFDALVPRDAHIEKLAGGFQFTEGPVWRPQEQYLWFSDVMANVVRQWSANGGATIALQHAGADRDGAAGTLVGPNGEIADKDGAVLMCQHGNRRIVRVSKDLHITPVVERFEGKRFNSPNDLVYKNDGSLYFTDPPYGLANLDDDPAKELPYNGVFRLSNGKRMRYDVADNGTVTNRRVFFDVTSEKEDGLPDGLKLDSQGNVYGSGPGGIWVFSPDGKHLGTIKPPETPANCNWGDDGRSLYITARTGLYRIKLATSGERTLYQ